MKIVIASENKGKIKEFARILIPLGFEVISRANAGMTDEIEETGNSFIENAQIKAMTTYKALGLPAIADDSGLEVDALFGAPGIYSARYSADDGAKCTSESNNAKLLKELDGVKNRKARYVCALCFVNKDGKMFDIVETCEGEIGLELEGNEGFGYDPLFKFNGVSFGNTSPKDKDLVSHRGKALRKLANNIDKWK
ncbi:MAG: RdgB/HAM1 family non-canonical purine NTP pyrophosphatase [Oscillospiraceae bacterium]|nr:RdgB/HAM1 family non-canonical purine NTP pyrophosphatase [Oscillospiraceae bacterium]